MESFRRVNVDLSQYAPYVKGERSWLGQDPRGSVLVKWGDYEQIPWPGGPRVLAAGGTPRVLVRELHPGPSLQEVSPLAPDAAVPQLDHLLSALELMHQHGLLHGRLKPTNVFVAGLTDSGVSVPERDPYAVLFRAPELSGARAAPIGPASDLYSAGACLCYMLTGQPPFEARDLSEAVRAPFLQAIPRLERQEDSRLVQGLDAMMLRLMSVDPDERYTSAGAARADLHLLSQEPETFVPGANELRQTLAAPALVGRHDLLQDLGAFVERGGLLQLVGEAGCGKSRLAEQARRMARARGHLVLRARARQQMADTPLQVLDELCQDLLSRRDPQEISRVLTTLGDWRPLVSTALPALGGSPQQGPEAHAWIRTRQALARFLQALGRPERPALLILEDMHWSPPDVLELLGAVEQWPKVAILVTSRRELALPGKRCHVEALSVSDAERMAASMLGRCQVTLLRAAASASAGNPYRLVNLLRRWVRQGVLQPGAQGWVAPEGAPALSWVPSPPNEVDDSAREILGLAAVVGREIDEEFLGRLFPPDAAREALISGVSAGLVQSLAEGDWAFTHDLAREAVLAWRPEERATRHLQIARALTEMEPLAAPDIAYHFHHAGRPAEALPFARRAATEARARHALSATETYLRIALAGAPCDTKLWEELGDVQRIAGRFPEAHQSYQRSLSLADSPLARSRALGGQAEAAFGEGRLLAARDLFGEALALLGHTLPARSWRKNLALVAELATLLLPRAPRAELDETERLASRLLDRLAYVLAYSDGYGLIWANLRCLNLTRVAPGRELGVALITHSVACLYIPPLTYRCRGVARKALGLLERYGSEYEFAAALARAATVELFLDNPSEAARLDEKAVPVLLRSGDRYDAHMSAYNLGLAYYFTGDLERARGVLRENLRDCLAVGDSLGCGFTTRVLGLLDPLTETEVSQIPLSPAFPSARILVDEVRGLYHLQKGELEEAIVHLEHGSRLALRSGDVFEELWTGLFLLRARRLQALRERGPQRSALERRAEREGVRFLRLAEKAYKVFLPRVCRELALLKLHQGLLQQAEVLLQRGLRAARAHGLRYEEGLALWELAEVGRLRGVNAERERAEATRLFRLTGSTWERSSAAVALPGVAMAERFEQVVFWTQTIASQRSSQEVVEASRQASEALLRCRCLRLTSSRAQADVATVKPRESDTLSALAIPLPWAENPRTELYCTSDESESHFGEQELRLAILIQGQARVALSNARLWSELQEREESFEHLFSNSPVGIAVLDKGGVVGQATPRLEAMLGRSPVHRELGEFLQPDDKSWLDKVLRELHLDRMPQRELRLHLPEGRLLWGELSLQRLPGPEEQIIVALADVSQRRLEQIAVFQDRERHMLAAEVHDVLSQPLVALQLQLEAVACQSPNLDVPLRDAARTARGVLHDTRSLIARLRSPQIERLRLSRAIEDAVEELIDRSSTQVGLEIDPGADGLPALSTLFAYRMVVEALTNCRRHARARRVRVRLYVKGTALRGLIADDGVGFSAEALAPGRFGLRIVAERADLLGGLARIRSAPGRGTAVFFYLPTARS